MRRRVAPIPSAEDSLAKECGVLQRYGIAIGLALTAAGCGHAERVPMFTPMREAVGIVEANRRLVTRGLKASGSVALQYVDENGRARHFDLDGKLQVWPPHHVRFVMQSALGVDEFEAGANPHKWWTVVRRPERRYVERNLGESGIAVAGGVPLRAEQLIECLGLSEVSTRAAGQRVVDEYQQLLFVGVGKDGHPVIDKEYWLDRYEPRLIRRILFRDAEGRVTLSAELNKYAPVGDRGLQLPRELRFCWPAERADMVYRIRRWEERMTLNATHRAFVSPRDRGVSFETGSTQTD